jgi:hypothetical protein
VRLPMWMIAADLMMGAGVSSVGIGLGFSATSARSSRTGSVTWSRWPTASSACGIVPAFRRRSGYAPFTARRPC